MNGTHSAVTLAAGTKVDGVALGVLLFFFVLVTIGGFWAANWRRTGAPASLEEWGLGGRSFGTVVTWFLLGGDLYTAYTFIAVPAAMYATGAVSGFFAIAYTILIYPIVFVFMPRMWSVSHSLGYVTAADFVRGRFDSRLLALAVAVTGIVATMPYIALQLVGIQAVIDTIGIGGRGNAFVRDLPLLIAFAVLAAYTYSSGLRAPAIIAFVKDSLVYLVIAVATVYVGVHVGFHHLFQAAETKMATKTKTGAPTGVFIPASNNYWAYSTLALGSALALFIYPHSMTAVLSGKSRNVIRRNTSILPVYSLMLGLLALLGYAAIASKTSIIGSDGKPNPQLAVPHFFRDEFPSWFAGVAYSAIAIGALVPAAIMSIAAANLFTRNIYREYLAKGASPKHEAQVSKITSLVVKFGALIFVLALDKQNAINLQLLGGVWILQTLVAVVIGLYTRWLHRWALLAGWAVGMVYGTVAAYHQKSAATRHFGGSIATFPYTHTKVYIAISALVLNVVVAVVGTLILRAIKAPAGTDHTVPADYYSEAAAPAEAVPGTDGGLAEPAPARRQ
ncbi:monocarboxylate uptake permease MctP [Jatrophihabitans lederbergiae]|jgi:SSS family solute:Na+ symporter|uniref:Sodium:solute symporter n=1 Tax=Jatrophihabitans lederbergiae TaxID=3075547 RepID=A0ABU2JBR2_9ACTN|nr:sodium:solute symporter [Jatrophihabitans sp. DSM 44399]MDT0262387.1 sodium:solute symporter [Jatrophihabitans sp. DSM 44399]